MKKKRKSLETLESQIIKELEVNNFAKTICAITEHPAPPDNNCPKCNTHLNYKMQLLIPTPICVFCPKCGWQESWWNYLGKKLISCEALPQGAYATFERAKFKVPKYKKEKKK